MNLDELADRGWRALETTDVGGWLARFSAGVTKRANSVWVRGDAPDPAAAVDEVESLYRERGLRATFQLALDDAGLSGFLADRGYRAIDETLTLIADAVVVTNGGSAGGSVTDGPAVDLSVGPDPDDDWLELWWAVDSRGGAAELAVAWRILAGVPALYATVRDADGPACVGRLALVDDWGGLYCLATRADVRRRGHARAIIGALANTAADRGVRRLWLQVLADNASALSLYESLGFERAGGYRYFVAP